MRAADFCFTVLYNCLGLPVYHALARTPLARQFASDDAEAAVIEEVHS